MVLCSEVRCVVKHGYRENENRSTSSRDGACIFEAKRGELSTKLCESRWDKGAPKISNTRISYHLTYMISIGVTDEEKLDPFEVWVWRRKLRVSGVDKKTNV